MVVTATKTNRVPLNINGTKINWGTFTDDGAGLATGDIDTDLTTCVRMKLQYTDAIAADKHAINETFPCDGHAVTIFVTASATGIWCAEGRV